MSNEEDKNCAFIAIAVTIAKIKHCALVLNGRTIFFFAASFTNSMQEQLWVGERSFLYEFVIYVLRYLGRHFWDFSCSMLILQPDLLWKSVKKIFNFSFLGYVLFFKNTWYHGWYNIFPENSIWDSGNCLFYTMQHKWLLDITQTIISLKNVFMRGKESDDM